MRKKQTKDQNTRSIFVIQYYFILNTVDPCSEYLKYFLIESTESLFSYSRL